MFRRITSHLRGASGAALMRTGLVALLLAGSHNARAQTCGAEGAGYFSVVNDRVSGMATYPVCKVGENSSVHGGIDKYENGVWAPHMTYYPHWEALQLWRSTPCPVDDTPVVVAVDDDYHQFSPGVLYRFSWDAYCLGGVYSTFASEMHLEPSDGSDPPYLKPSDDWDPPCETCVGGERSGGCQHATSKSFVYRASPDLVTRTATATFQVQRTYRTSQGSSVGPFGPGWQIVGHAVPLTTRQPFSATVDTTYGYIVHAADGKRTFFLTRFSDATPTDVFDSQSSDGRVLTRVRALDGGVSALEVRDREGLTETYEYLGGSWRLRNRQDLFGQATVFTYDAVSGMLQTVEDALGRTTTLEYGPEGYVSRLVAPGGTTAATYLYAAGRLDRVTYPDGTGERYNYATNGLLSGIRVFDASNPTGVLIKYIKYYADGKVKAVSEGPGGRSVENVYYADHTESVEWDDLNSDGIRNDGTPEHSTTYEISTINGAQTVTGVVGAGCGCSQRTEYGRRFQPVKTTNRNGIVTLRDYTAAGDLIWTTEAAGTPDEKTTQYEYDYVASPAFPGQFSTKRIRMPSVALPAGEKVTTEEFDLATGMLRTRTEQGYSVEGAAISRVTAYTYTGAGAIESVDGPLPGVQDKTTYVYHPIGHPAAGMLWKVTEPSGAMTEFVDYDELGNPRQKKDPNGNVTILSYNARGLLLSSEKADGENLYEYDAQGNLTKVTRPRGNATSYFYDGAGLTTILDSEGRVDYTYARGNKTAESVRDANGVVTKTATYQYDDANRFWRASQASGDFEEYLYDANGNLTHKKLYAVGAPAVAFKTTVQTYDYLDRLKSVSVEGSPYLVSYTYDVQGNLASVTDPVGQITMYRYDDFGRLGRTISPETGTTTYTHDAAGNVRTRVDNLQRTTTYDYDGLGRLAGVTYPAPTQSVQNRYDSYSTGSHPNAIGRLTEVADASGFRRFLYSANGQVKEVLHSIEGWAFTTAYSYDANGNLETMTYPDGRTIRYHYPADPASDRVESVTSTKNGLDLTLAANVTFKPSGPLASLEYGNGAHLEHASDLGHRTESLAVTHQVGNPMPSRAYDYDAEGNIHTITRDVAEQHEFTYDLLGRLEHWNHPGGSQTYTYDANGNRQTFESDSQLTSYAYDSAVSNILASSTGAISRAYDHDAVGNITGWGQSMLGYDAEGRILNVNQGAEAIGEYVFNSDGLRAKKSAEGQTTYFEYDLQGHLIHEVRAWENVAVDYVYLGEEPLAMLVSDGVSDGGTVAPLALGHGNLSPATAQAVANGGTVNFTVTPDAGYRIGEVSGCGGALSGNVYTTGPVSGDCTVAARFLINTYVVTPTVGAHGTITPSTPQAVAFGETTWFTIWPDWGYHFVEATGCGGTLNGVYYTTGPITSDCTVSASFEINTYTITPSAGANGSLYPQTPQVITPFVNASFTVQPATGYHLSSITGCNGTLDGSTYTTGQISTDCTVTATFAIDTFTATPSAGAGGQLSPPVAQAVPVNQTTSFTVVPNSGYHLTSISGCGGTLVGNIYTTGPISGNCTVSAAFSNTFTVTPSAGPNGTINPSWAQPVIAGQTAAFTLQPNTGHHIQSVSGCGGTLNGSTFTTGPVDADCTVSATFAVNIYTVTPVAGPNGALSESEPFGVPYLGWREIAAIPNPGYHVASVTGCGGTLNGVYYGFGPVVGDCTINASFEHDPYLLSVSKLGAGSGTVTSTPAGIACGATCSYAYTPGTVVTLSQAAATGAVFTGWSGGCTGTGACLVTMNAAQTVNATFAQGITVTVPNGGQTWSRNSTYTINWNYLGSPGTKVKIELLKNGEVNRTIASSASIGSGGAGSYNWKVQSNQAVGTDYRIRVTSTTATGYTDTSDANFTIN